MQTEEDCIMRSLITCTIHHILLLDQIKECEMGGHVACTVDLRKSCKLLDGRDHLEDLGVDGKVVL